MELLPVLTDPHGRRIRKLRVSLTDVCNFRCTYCMPANVRFQPSATLLPPEALVAMVDGLVEAGIREVRLTGGEPLARREFREIAAGVAALPLDKLGLTTNGYWLSRHLAFLDEIGCRHVNVSLDSLRPDRFEAITRTPFFDRVLGAVLEAKAMGFPVKVNVVLLRGANDDEVEDFVAFSAAHGVPVRFLEYMKIGPQRGRHDGLFVPAGEVIERLRLRHALTPVEAEADATAFSFRTGDGAEVGFIASESRPFCATCSRLRLSARGRLRACLMSEAGRSLVGVPREDYPEVLAEVMAMKPTGRLPEIAQPMHEIGG
ncbi:MAG TPA: GTP 3',8-cyclase MoaA [Rubricoccaceae bacterium]|nr:GTP 3',8-cyclase MoaA [Rubricoccaceae bacterium]